MAPPLKRGAHVVYVDAAGVHHPARFMADVDDHGRALLLLSFGKAARVELRRARETRDPTPGAFFRPVAPS